MNHYYERHSIKRDCVNFHNGGCKALNGIYCATEPCKFYKTPQMVHEQIERIRKRIPDYVGGSYEL